MQKYTKRAYANQSLLFPVRLFFRSFRWAAKVFSRRTINPIHLFAEVSKVASEYLTLLFYQIHLSVSQTLLSQNFELAVIHIMIDDVEDCLLHPWVSCNFGNVDCYIPNSIVMLYWNNFILHETIYHWPHNSNSFSLWWQYTLIKSSFEILLFCFFLLSDTLFYSTLRDEIFTLFSLFFDGVSPSWWFLCSTLFFIAIRDITIDVPQPFSFLFDSNNDSFSFLTFSIFSQL
jgi:hypothetical protein